MSTPVASSRPISKISGSSMFEPAIAGEGRGRFASSSTLRSQHHSAPFSAATKVARSSSRVHFGAGDEQQIVEAGARQQPRDGNAGEHAARRQSLDQRRGVALHAQVNSLKKLSLSTSTPSNLRQHLRQRDGVGVIDAREPRRGPSSPSSVRWMREGQRAEAGIGADVGGRLVAADMLLARRKRQHVAAPAVGVDRLAAEAARHLPQEFLRASRTARHKGRRN